MDIALASLIVACIGVILTLSVRRISLNAQKESRISNVVNATIPHMYPYPSLPSVINYLKKGGILNLKNEREVADALERIHNIMHIHPFGSDKDKIYKTNKIKRFLEIWDGTKTVAEVISAILEENK